MEEVRIGEDRLEVAPKFCYFGDLLSVGGRLWAHGCNPLQVCIGEVQPIPSSAHQSTSTANIPEPCVLSLREECDAARFRDCRQGGEN